MSTVHRASIAALLFLPGLVTVYFSFNAGGYFPGEQALVAIVLIVALALRLALAEEPFEGFSRPLAVAAGGLALYALWTLASAAWSDSTARALLEFDRVLLYLAALVLFGSVARTSARVRWMTRGLALGIVVVCGAGLATRLLPDTFPTAANLFNPRLSHPLTYSNALGILAVVGLTLCLGLTCRIREPAAGRILGAAAIPMLAATLLLTFSRGAIWAGGLGVVAYLLIGHSRGTLSGLLATVPATLVAVKSAYAAGLLATTNPTTVAATAQGHHVARVVILSMAAAAVARAALVLLDRRLARVTLSRKARVRVVRPIVAASVVGVLVTALALGVPGFAQRQYERFTRGDQTQSMGPVRERLTSLTSVTRPAYWRVARRQFEGAKLAGTGAGTYELAWERRRPFTGEFVKDAHSLYYEVLGELGLLGLVLLCVSLLAILGGIAAHARGRNRPVYATLFAAGLAWAIHAGVDWDWEMPALTLWLFALGGAALATRPTPGGQGASRGWRSPPQPARVVIALSLLSLTVVPTLVAVSEGRLEDSQAAFTKGDCAAATAAAKASISAVSTRPEPYELLAYCAIRSGDEREGLRRAGEAIERDPDKWTYHYDMAIARAAAGLDPRAAARKARRLNPREAQTKLVVDLFRTGNRRVWARRARSVATSTTTF